MNIVKVMSAIDSLQKGWYNYPRSYYDQKKIQFICRSYEKSAFDEIRLYLLKNYKKEDVISEMDKFCHQVDDFACKAQNKNTKFMFSVYYDVATNVLDMLLSIK